jgi:hypothetical protein
VDVIVAALGNGNEILVVIKSGIRAPHTTTTRRWR